MLCPSVGASLGVRVVRGTFDSVVLAVSTLEGLLYEYRISELGSTHSAPKAVLEGEWALIGSPSLG